MKSIKKRLRITLARQSSGLCLWCVALLVFAALVQCGCASNNQVTSDDASAKEGRPSAEASTSSGAAASPNSQYIIFAIQNMPLANARPALAEIKEFYGPNDPASNRLYGFSLWSLMLFKQSPDELRAVLNQAFDMAEEFDLPVYLHVDMLHNSPSGDKFKGPELKFYEDPMMCEWVAFPKSGETHGPVPRYWCNWGAWFSAPAFPCYASPRLRDLVTSQLQQGVLSPLHERLNRLKAQGKEHLFAGICLGWETMIPDYVPGHPFVAVDPKDPPVDRFSQPPATMQRWEMGQLGYAALHHLGYDQSRLDKEAAEQGISPHALFIALCHRVNHDYTQLLTKTAFDSGISRDKIYSHTIAVSTVNPAPSTFSPPVWAAVNPYCIPGFTLDNYGAAVYDLAKLKQSITAADPSQSHFSVAETYFRRGMTEQQWTAYLDEMFGNGATLMHILAWHSGQNEASPFYVPKKMAGPHLSVSKWLQAAEGGCASGTRPPSTHDTP